MLELPATCSAQDWPEPKSAPSVAARGQIVGIFGLIGAGRTELLKAIYLGRAGQVLIGKESVPRRGAAVSIRNGLVFRPRRPKAGGDRANAIGRRKT